MPSINQLVNEFSCSKNTVIKAFSELEKEHIVYSIPKKGFFVAKKTKEYTESNIIDFSSAGPDLSLVSNDKLEICMEESIHSYKSQMVNYGSESGLLCLRKQILANILSEKFSTSLDNVIVTSGSQQAIDILVRMTFPNKKETILVEQPSYFGTLKSIAIANEKVMGIDVLKQTLDLNRLEYIFKNNDIKFFYIMSRYHNPLGFSYSHNLKKRIVELAEIYDVYIVEDDYLGDLTRSTSPQTLFSMDTSEKVIYLKSYSKTFLPGLRLGAIFLPKLFIQPFLEHKFCHDFCTSSTSQAILSTFMSNGMFNEHLKIISNYYSKKMKIAIEACSRYLPKTVSFTKPHSGFYMTLILPDSLQSAELAAILKLNNVLIDDISRMFLPEYKQTNLVRISVSQVKEEHIDTGIKLIAQTIQKILTKKGSIFKSKDLYI